MNIFEKIGMLFKGVVNKYFTKALDDIKDSEKLLHDAGAFTYNLYSWEQEHKPDIDAFTAIIPGDWDDNLVKIAEAALPKIAAHFTAFEIDVIQAKTLPELVQRMNLTLKGLDPDTWTFITHNITSLLAHEILKLKDPNTLLGKVFAVIESVWQAFSKQHVSP